MNLKKISVCGLVLALAGIFFALPTQAQEKEIVRVKTNIIQPVSVEFLPSRDGMVKGMVSGAVQNSNIEKVTFIIKNYPQYDEIWREHIQWDDTFLQEGRIDIPFQFDVSEITIAERFVLTTEFIDEKGKLVASGSAGAQIPKDFAKVSMNLIENVMLDVGADVKVSFLFVNGSKTQMVKPELRLIEHSVGGDEIFVLDNEEAVEMVPNEEKEFTLSFTTPKDPENYIVAVRVMDDNESPVTGYVRDNFLVEGDFAEVRSIQIIPDRAVKAGETVEVIVSGVVDNEKGELEMNMEAFLDPGNEEADSIQESRVFTAEGDEFTETFSFTAPVPTKKMSVEVKVSRNGNIIEEKTNSFVAKKESASFLIEIPKQVVEKYGDGGFEVWMIVVFALAMIVLLMSVLHRKKRMNIWFLLIVPFLSMSTADAAWQVDWFNPDSGTIYNTQAKNTEQTQDFNIIVFEGTAYDAGGAGYFAGGLTAVDVKFYQGGTHMFTESVSTTPTQTNPNGDVTILSETYYTFDLNISAISGLTAGDWTVEILFNNDIETTSSTQIGIDVLAPTIGFSYTPDTFTNDTVGVSISCADDKADCLQEPTRIQYAPFTLNVLGNFSDIYNPTKIRGFEVCDQVANCTSAGIEELSIEFYDPVVPTLTGMSLLRSGGLSALTGNDAWSMAADELIKLSLSEAIDPDTTDVLAQDTNACGNDLDDDTYLAADVEVSFTATPAQNAMFPGAWITRQKNGGGWNDFLFIGNGSGSFTARGTIVEESEYQFQLRIKTGDTTFSTSPTIAMGATWSGTLGSGTEYETAINNLTVTIQNNTQRCTPKYFVCAVNHPTGGGSPQRVEMTEFLDSGQTCGGLKGANWEPLPIDCGFTFTFPFVLEDCTECIADSSCATNTCTGSTCEDTCGNIHDGTKNCALDCGSDTIANCDVFAKSNGGTSGTCDAAAGYTGTCSYTCISGSWDIPNGTNNCALPVDCTTPITTAGCKLSSTLNGGTSGTCDAASGYTGTCSYTCNNGTFGIPSTNDCVTPDGCAATTINEGTTSECVLPFGSNGLQNIGTCSTGYGECYSTCTNGTWGTPSTNTCREESGCSELQTDNCYFAAVPSGSGGAGGTCPIGYTGFCQAICSDGTWTDIQDNCIKSEITIVAAKVICENESMLPDWNYKPAGAAISATTAADYANAYSGCSLAEGWSFQWSPAPDYITGAVIGPGDANIWTTFGPTNSNGVTSTTIDITGMAQLGFREILQTGYIPFSDANTPYLESSVSAELYCMGDGKAVYGNLEYVGDGLVPVAGTTYYCVAFNVPIASSDCAADTINDCILSATTHAGTSGTCSSGGDCSYRCTNGTWLELQNTCTTSCTAVNGDWSDYGSWTCDGFIGPLEEPLYAPVEILLEKSLQANLFAAALDVSTISRSRSRTCTNPSLSCEGLDCVGSAIQTDYCGADEICSAGACVSVGCTTAADCPTPDQPYGTICESVIATCTGNTCGIGTEYWAEGTTCTLLDGSGDTGECDGSGTCNVDATNTNTTTN